MWSTLKVKCSWANSLEFSAGILGTSSLCLSFDRVNRSAAGVVAVCSTDYWSIQVVHLWFYSRPLYCSRARPTLATEQSATADATQEFIYSLHWLQNNLLKIFNKWSGKKTNICLVMANSTTINKNCTFRLWCLINSDRLLCSVKRWNRAHTPLTVG